MAVSTSSYFSNSIVGAPQVGADIDLYENSANPKFSVGFGFTRGDGNKYRYGHFGAIVAAGAVVATDLSEVGQTNILKGGTIVSRITKSGGQSMNNNAVGSRYAQLTITASNDQFAGGYLTIHSGTGFGFCYHIKGNDATSANVTSDTIVELYDPIVVALDSNSEIAITGCAYSDLEGATVTDPAPAGVAVTNMSAGNYGWVCTHGVTAVLNDASIALKGKSVALSSSTTGAIMTSAGGALGSSSHLTNMYLLGRCIEPGTSAAYATVFLTIE